MMTTSRVLPFANPSVTQQDMEVVLGLENQIRLLQAMKQDNCLKILDRILKGSDVEPGVHTAATKVTDSKGRRVFRLVINGRLMAAVAFLILMVGSSARAADDPGGWSKAKWGMTDAQLLAAFPDAKKLDPPEKVNGARVFIESIDIAEIPFEVYLCPEKPGGKLLGRVIIAPRDRADQTDLTFQKLESLLVERYGRPWKSSDGIPGVDELIWSFKTTTINLTRGKLPGSSLRIISIEYKRKSTDPL